MSEAVKELIDIVIKLRSDNGCDWDRKQTSQSLTPHLIEEANEVVDAILEDDSENLKEELGDLLLHVVFQAVIASEKKSFEFEEVVQQINEKLIKRHPHIFDENFDGENLSNAKNWELSKKKEKNRESILDGMPKSLPTLIVAQRYQDKTGAVGFEWENVSQAMNKVDEELGELKQAIKNNDLNNIEEEIGDLLITIVNLARFFDISADLALRKTNQKFYRRFNFIEKIVKKNNQKIENISLGELLNYWEKAKNEEKNKIVGITFGSFDLCHYGHALMFEECKEYCDYLIVGVQSDPSIDRPEKNKPVQSHEERIGIVNSLKFVDEVVTYDTEADLIKVLKNIQPDVRILGADHEGKPFTGHELPIKCIFNTRDHGYSTSELRKRVFEAEKVKSSFQLSN